MPVPESGAMVAGMKTLATLLLLLAPVAAEAQPPAAPAQRVACAVNVTAFPALIGKPQAEVEAALWAMPGIAAIRAGGPNAPMTMDFREDRATLTVVDGRVTRIVCG